MTGRSPARLLAPVALVVCAIALFAIVSSGGEESGDGGASARPSTTATPTPASAKPGKKGKSRTYTVKPGDTPSGIAEKTGVSLDALLSANPKADPNGLTPGQKLKLP